MQFLAIAAFKTDTQGPRLPDKLPFSIPHTHGERERDRAREKSGVGTCQNGKFSNGFSLRLK